MTPSNNRKEGFTLVEMLIASGLAAVVLAAFMNSFTSERRNLYVKTMEQELQQRVRAAHAVVSRDLRASANSVVINERKMPLWFSSLPGGTGVIFQNPYAVEGTNSTSDTAYMVGSFDNASARIITAVAAGATSLSMTPLTNTYFTSTVNAGDILILGSVEPVQATSGGTTPGIDADILAGTAGTHLAYPVGTQVDVLTVVKYSVETVDGRLCLLREDARLNYATTADKVIATDIEDFQISEANNDWTVTIRGRTENVLPKYTDPTYADGYKHFSLTSTVSLRHPDPTLDISTWEPTAMFTPTPGPTP